MTPILVEAWRGDAVESEHAGSVAIVDADGTLALGLGDIDRPVFPRSAVKALQALPLVESDAADRLGLTDEELALACASHNGEAVHVRTAASMLAKAGVDADVLECGAHWPYLESWSREMAARGEAPTALNNNCSGKHAGFVCLACALMGWNDSGIDLRQYLKGYVKPEHPVMREVSDALHALTTFDLSRAPRGTDGCSIPTYGIPLRHLAHGFARFGTGTGLRDGQARAARRLRQAVAAAPYMVGGAERLDSAVMQRLGERVFCKVGAEGMYCAALPGRGLGVAIKMQGRQQRARRRGRDGRGDRGAGAAGRGRREFMRGYSDVTLRNWNGSRSARCAPHRRCATHSRASDACDARASCAASWPRLSPRRECCKMGAEGHPARSTDDPDPRRAHHRGGRHRRVDRRRRVSHRHRAGARARAPRSRARGVRQRRRRLGQGRRRRGVPHAHRSRQGPLTPSTTGPCAFTATRPRIYRPRLRRSREASMRASSCWRTATAFMATAAATAEGVVRRIQTCRPQP
jgi:L-asparaginase II